MRYLLFFLAILMLVTLACGGSATTTPAPDNQPVFTSTLPVPSASETPSPVETSTPAQVAGLIRVDTLEQEVYPFEENGKCSLAEAVVAANTGELKDSCAAGMVGESIIELMPGEYRFTHADTSPPLFEWMPSLLEVGSALPEIVFPLSIRGNGAVLIRDEEAEPFRFFEVMVNSKLTLEDMTLQNGDVVEDWGGAIYSSNASMDLKNVRFIDNHAELGGAVYFTLGRITVGGGEFIGNTSVTRGGGMFIDSSQSTIETTRFEANDSGSDGGGMYLETVRLVLTDSIFLKNRVTGESYGNAGGGMYASHVELMITGSQFYQNESPMYGGAIGINNPELAGIDPEEGDPIQPLLSSPVVTDFLTSIPGFQSTLEAHPSGIYVEFHESAEIHDNCFANNVTLNPDDPNWTSGLVGRASVADGNYWGDPSGPSGMGPGTGDSVGKRLVFAPFLTSPQDFCDPNLSDQG
ncbi:MAG TPA: hypothetical protein VMJ90_00930 [Anaerolineales bacterium]|nr:hypothetical protein [Anaerolineales bacterium]